VPITYAVAELFGPRDRWPPSIERIQDGIDVREFHPSVTGARIRAELGIDPGAPIVGFVGRLHPGKGADIFVRAAAEIALWQPEAQFLVCGGELRGYEAYAAGVRQLSSSLGLDERIHFTESRYGPGDIPEVMAAIDVLLHLPRVREALGLVLIEAMATARPVIAFRTGGIAEVVVDGLTGELVPPGDWQAAARAVLGLLADPSRAHALGAAGRIRAEKEFEIGAHARRIEALYASLLGRAAR
jgi:glycosyltransferase involved in cell wall biosynthesis